MWVSFQHDDSDEATSGRKMSAYVTFVSKESVEKALELRGSQFFSRTIKMLRKAESTVATPGPAQQHKILQKYFEF
ncbi:hypothetical protein CIPAW_16G078400 [Carya illinoinensis]|uniref:RRM domain-containing protein n=1 Tax=Carya illinoinensis TaxID=32201 RepID=A0A8T1N7P5_CARIL|nr:hypothetical protein CIPAW_16G078400 [Carya illinoinensis]